MPIDTTRSDVNEMLPTWKKIRDVLAGEDAIKAAGSAYLPAPDGMRPGDYSAYLERGCFFNGTERTRQALVGLAFAKDPDVRVPATFPDLLHDVTQSGIPLADFGVQALQEVLAVGRFGMLVDLADNSTPEPNRRPYVVGYAAEDIRNWCVARVGADAYAPTFVVLCERLDDPESPDRFAPRTIEQYRLLELRVMPGFDAPVYTVSILRRTDRRELEPVGEPVIPMRRGVPLDFIPFIVCNTSAVTFDLQRPPLLDLANVNLSLWRTSVDLEHGRRYTALPTPWAVGLPIDMHTVNVGPTSFLKLEGPHAAAGMLEFTGVGLGELRLAVTEKLDQMSALGARLLDQGATKPETAEAARIRAATQHANLRTVASTLSLGLTTVVRWMAWWAGVTDTPRDPAVGVELNREFAAFSMSADDVKAEVLRWQAGASSFDTLYEILARGARTRPGVTAAQERHEIAAEGNGFGGGGL